MPTHTPAELPHLSATFLTSHPELTKTYGQSSLPDKVLQFGEGGFLRGFVDWMIHGMNQAGIFNGRAIVVQPIAHGQVEKLNEQDGAYTLLMRGIEEGKVTERQELITSISRGINPYTDYANYLDCASNPDLRFIVSNTTEAGIVFNAADTDRPAAGVLSGQTHAVLSRTL
jgi:tagaturonate reductase